MGETVRTGVGGAVADGDEVAVGLGGVRHVGLQGAPSGQQAFGGLGAALADGAQGDAEAAVDVEAVAGGLFVQDALGVDGEFGGGGHPAYGQVPPAGPAQAAADEEQGDVLVQAVVVAFAVEGRVGQDLPVLGQGVPQGGCAYVFAEADQGGGA